MTPPGLEQITS